MKKKRDTANVSYKNYLAVLLIFIFVIFGSLYIFEWYKVYKSEKLSSSYLVKTNTVVNVINNYDELKSVFLEAPDEYFVYISYANSQEVYNMEKDLQKLIIDYKLQDNFYYLDVTEMKNDKDFLERINSLLGLKDNKVTKVPTIVYFEEKMNSDNILTREDNNIMQSADFAQLLDIKGFQK